MSGSRAKAIAALLIATSAWGSLFLVTKPVLAHIDPVWFTFSRYTLSSAALALLVAAGSPGAWARLRAHAPRLALTGFVGYGAFSTLALVGLAHSVPSHGAVVMATMPITTQLVRWLLDGARPTFAQGLGTLLALAGVVTVSGVLLHDSTQSTVAGDLTAWVGTLGWIFYTRSAARLPSFSVLEYTALTSVASWPLLLLGALALTGLGWAQAPDAQALALSWHALAYGAALGLNRDLRAKPTGVRTLGVVTGTAFLNFIPVSALLMSTALGAPPSAHELVGAAMVVSALFIHTGAQKRVALRQQRRPVAV